MKKNLNAKISYMKAWYDRRRAIELVYGISGTNFVELLKYVEAFVQLSNISLYLKHPCCRNFFKFVIKLEISQTQLTHQYK